LLLDKDRSKLKIMQFIKGDNIYQEEYEGDEFVLDND